jgi:hypothetical protein
MTRFLVVLFASLVAASCAQVRTNVAVTHALPPAGAAKTVAILPYTNTLGARPDFQGNASKLAAQLQSKGYTVVAREGGAPPDYLAFFLYTIDNGTAINQNPTTAQPFVGSIISYGYRTAYGRSTRRLYKRMLTVEIVDRARFNPNTPQSYIDARVYTGSVTSDGACPALAPVIDPMLNALFADFPGQSGQLRALDIPTDTTCGLDRFG